MASRPSSETRVFRSSIPWRSSSSPTRRSILCRTRLRPTALSPTTYQGPTRNFKANNQGDIKIEYDPRRGQVTGFYSMSTAYDGSTALLAISFPGRQPLSHKLLRRQLGSHLLAVVVNSARIGFTRTVWNQNLPQIRRGSSGPPATRRSASPFPTRPSRLHLPEHLAADLSGVGNPVSAAA